MSSIEQRKYIRVALGDIVEYTSPAESFKTGALDISYKGMQLESAVPFVSGKDACIVLNSHHLKHPLKIPCRFLHAKKNGPGGRSGTFAVKFVYGDQEQKRAVEKFVRMVKEKSISMNFKSEEIRETCRINCLITPITESFNGVSLKIIENISQNGLFVRVEGDISRIKKLPLKFNLPNDERPIDVRGEIIYLDDDSKRKGSAIKGVGIRFDQISPIDKQRIENFVLQQVSNISFKKFYQSIYCMNDKNGLSFKEKDKIKTILQNAKKRKIPIHMLFEKSMQNFQAEIDDMGGDYFCVDVRDGSGDFKFNLGDLVYFSFNYGRGSYYFRSSVIQSAGSSAVLQMPSVINHSEKRSLDRSQLVVPEKVEIKIEPQDRKNEDVINGEIIDVSPTGLSFKVDDTPLAKQVFMPGSNLKKMMISCAHLKHLGSTGEVKYISYLTDENGKACLKVGVEAGIKRERCRFIEIDEKAWENESFFDDDSSQKVNIKTEPNLLKKLIRYKNKDGREIVSYLDATKLNTSLPVIILPPAFGKKKETLSPVAATILCNFKAMKKDAVIIRYDGINRPGESFKDERYRRKGWEMLDYTVTQGTDDLRATIDFCVNNPYFKAEEIIVISFSLASLKARKILSLNAKHKVGCWVSVMGVADGQSSFRNISGGLDIIGNYKAGLVNGVSALLGHIIDLDGIARDMIDNKYAYLSDARAEFSRINIPVIWLYGKYDSWINHDDVKDIMTVASKGGRMLIEMPTGHNLRTSKDALRAFRIITQKIYEHLYGQYIIPADPPQDLLVRMIVEERERITQSVEMDIYNYWRMYLMGADENSYGYDFLKNLKDFRNFLALQEEMLDIKDGNLVADLGCGTGIFMENYLNNFQNKGVEFKRMPKFFMVDFIEEALNKCRLKYINYKKRLNNFLPEIEFINIDLSVNRFVPVKKFVRGHYKTLSELKGRIEGLSSALIDKIAGKRSRKLENILKGREITVSDLKMLRRSFRRSETECIIDFNRAARFVSKRLKKEDFEKMSYLSDIKGVKKIRCAQIRAHDLIFKRLKFHDSDLNMKIPFRDKSIDRILASLLVSYLLNPDECIKEYYRVLKPGGRIVLSSMKPDADISRIFTRYVEKVKHSDVEDTEIKDVEQNLGGARSMLNEVANLFELEEDGYFRFFSAEELEQMLKKAGFKNIKTFNALGDPPQAHVATAQRGSS